MLLSKLEKLGRYDLIWRIMYEHRRSKTYSRDTTLENKVSERVRHARNSGNNSERLSRYNAERENNGYE
jgi:hypothetical protein